MTAIAPPPVTPAEASAVSPAITVRALAARAKAKPRAKSLGMLALFAGASAAAAVIGARVVAKRRNRLWYRFLSKPSFTPPNSVFRYVWPVLYSLGAVSAWRVWKAPPSRARTAALGLWTAQLACNAAWTPLFFGAHRKKAALADLGGNASTLAAYTIAARKVDPLAAWMTVPYLGWLGFAGALNGSIVAKNG